MKCWKLSADQFELKTPEGPSLWGEVSPTLLYDITRFLQQRLQNPSHPASSSRIGKVNKNHSVLFNQACLKRNYLTRA